MRGKLNKQGKTIFRRKRVFDSQGNVIGEFAQESYVVENPRDWKKNPPTGAEKANIDSWRMACQRAKTEMAGLDCFIRATIYRTLMQNNSKKTIPLAYSKIKYYLCSDFAAKCKVTFEYKL